MERGKILLCYSQQQQVILYGHIICSNNKHTFDIDTVWRGGCLLVRIVFLSCASQPPKNGKEEGHLGIKAQWLNIELTYLGSAKGEETGWVLKEKYVGCLCQ